VRRDLLVVDELTEAQDEAAQRGTQPEDAPGSGDRG